MMSTVLLVALLYIPEVIFCHCHFRSPYAETMCERTLPVVSASELECATFCCFSKRCNGYYYHSETSACLRINPSLPEGDCSYYNSLTWKSWKKLSAPCYDTDSFVEYTGHYSLSVSNVTCQRWDRTSRFLDINFPDTTVTEAANYCRDPVGFGYLWCYINPEATIFETCGMSRCVCYTEDDHRQYTGTLSLTKSGKTCQRWDADFPHLTNPFYDFDNQFPDATRADAANYCRNPTSSTQTRVWCYTTDILPREHCDLEKCKELIWQ